MILIPLADDNSDQRTVPLVNYALIAANVFVFVVFQQLGNNVNFTFAYACVPEEIVTGKDVAVPTRVVRDPETGKPVQVPGPQPTPIPVYLTILTSMFMHAGFMHLAGNMLFLWIFGDNIENAMGHVRYLIFYLLGGILATLCHVFVSAGGDHAQIPTLGASGAISAVLGGYLLMFPHRRVRVLLLRVITEVPAIVAIGMWFVFQIVSGLQMFGGKGDGVAYGAHIGGFVAGLILVKPFMIGVRQSDA